MNAQGKTGLEGTARGVLALLCRVGLHHFEANDPFRDYWLTWFSSRNLKPTKNVTRETCKRCGRVRYTTK